MRPQGKSGLSGKIRSMHSRLLVLLGSLPVLFPGRLEDSAGKTPESSSKFPIPRSSLLGSAVTNSTRIHEDVGLIAGLAQRVKDRALP